MGNVLGNCCHYNKPNRVSHIYPDQFVSFRLEPTNKNGHRFLHIPDKHKIDETLELLDLQAIMDEKLFDILQETLGRLMTIKSNILDTTQNLSPKKMSRHTLFDSDIGSDTISTLDSPEATKRHLRERLAPMTSSLTTTLYPEDFQDGTLIVDIQKGTFLHPDELRTENLHSPFIKIDVCDQEEKEAIWSYSTLPSKDAVFPDWEEVAEHEFHDVMQLGDWVVQISLNYNQGGKIVSIGDSHSFSISGLIDQKVHTKQLDFKDSITKGIIAKVVVRFQFVHDLNDLHKKLIYEVDSRILRLKRLKTAYLKHQNLFNQNVHSNYGSFEGSNNITSLGDGGKHLDAISFSEGPGASFYMN
jgi:hypothetical protein